LKIRDLARAIEETAKDIPEDIEKGLETIFNEFQNGVANHSYDIPTNIQKGEIDKAITHLENIGVYLFRLWSTLKDKQQSGEIVPETISPEFAKETPQ